MIGGVVAAISGEDVVGIVISAVAGAASGVSSAIDSVISGTASSLKKLANDFWP